MIWDLINCEGKIEVVDDIDENWNPIEKTFIIITPKTGYLLDTTKKVKLTIEEEDVDGNWNPIINYVDRFVDINNDEIMRIEKDLYFSGELYSVSCETNVEKPVPGFTITNINLINCTCNYNNGDILEQEKPIIIIPDEGYRFRGGFHDYPAYMDSSWDEHYFENVDGSQLYLLETWEEDIILIATYSPDKEKSENTATFTDIYNITNLELKELSKVRWVSDGTNIIDLGSYIANLFILPVKVDDMIKGDLQNIYLGDVDTKVRSIVLNSYEMVVDLGSIIIPELYNNVYDYINTRCILHLPYFDKIFINNEYVINQTLNIEYVINLYTGYATVNIKSSFTDTIIESRISLISTSIPYMQGNNVVGSFNNSNKNDIDRAYVEVVRNKPYNVSTPFGKPVIEYGKLLDYKGFIRCDKVMLSSGATNIEKEDVINLLNKGVIIND